MKNKEKRLSYQEAWKRNFRAWKIWFRLDPKFFFSMISSSVFGALSPYVTIWLSAQIINELAGNRKVEQLVKWILLELISYAILTFISTVLGKWNDYERICAEQVHERIYMDKMLKLDYADIDRQYVFDLYSQIMQNYNWSGWGIYKTFSFFQDIIMSIMQIIGGIGLSVSLFTAKVPENYAEFSFLNHFLCAVVIIGVMMVITVLSPVCYNQGSKFWEDCASKINLGNRYFNFYSSMSRERKRSVDLRIYNQQEKVCNVYLKKIEFFTPGSELAHYAKTSMGVWVALSQSLSVVFKGIVYLYVCLKAWAGAFGVGSVTQYVGAITNLFSGVGSLLRTLGDMRINSGFLEASFEFLDIPNNMYQGSLTTEKRADRDYNIEFKNVSFKYPESDTWALRHINMKFRVGSRLAVVGINGSGKTTFIKLLCRLYDPTEGEILLNGIDIRKYKYNDYINVFSVVFQDFQLFSMPLGENVAGAAEYDRKKVMDCLKKAGFEDRMNDMPKGLDTYLYKELDKEGVEISGGEAQKIAIARTLYKDAPFIILDEPTAALDPIAEADIYSKFNEIVGDKTAIYISHRLSSCKFCNEILVFHEGTVIQQGTHEELVADKKGKYYELWNAQAQYYTEKSA